MLKHTKGCLLSLAEDGKFDIIVHGCNCFCTMGAGIAKTIKNKYPEAYQADCNTKKGDINKLGTYSYHNTGKFIIINAYTQYKWSGNKDLFEYHHFNNILDILANTYSNNHFGFPYIGMGLAKGNKQKILDMLENFAIIVHNNGGSVTLVEF